MADWFTENAPPTPAEAAMLAQIRTRESSGDYAARNPKPGSTAAGAYQFIGPTWQQATQESGTPVYSSAAAAPPAIQDANALHMLRKHGPNATITWAASGPYKQPGPRTGTAAGQPASNDVLSRIATGDVTPDELAQYLQPEQSSPAFSPAPAAVQPASPAISPVQPGDWFAKNAPPPPAPPPSALDEAKRLGSIAAGASGLTAAKDILANGAKTVMDFLVGNPVNPQDVEKFNTTLLGLEHGVYGELPRSGQQMVESLKAFGRGDINAAADHLWFSIPFLGAAGENMKPYLERGDIKGALAHAFGTLAPVAAHPTITAAKGAIEALPEAVQALPQTVSRTATATGAAAKAAARDVAIGTAKLGAGYALEQLGPVGGAVKSGIEFTTGLSGARQIGRGLKKGVAAGRASFAETAPPVAPEVPGAGFAVPKEPPITGPTDEALVHLYSVETDPVKRSALQAQLIDHGLIKAEPATTPLEANPYRDYSQNALQRVYALEQDTAKRALIEQTARDRNLTLLTREGRRATAAVPETGEAEARGPSLTQDDALMLRYLGETDPLAADAETIGIARKLAADSPELLNKLRASGGAAEPIVTQPTPEEQAAPTTQVVVGPSFAPGAAELPPSLQRMVKAGQQAGEFTPEEQARADAILENVEPQTPTPPQPTPPRKPPVAPAAPQAAPAAPEAPAATREPSVPPIAPEAAQTLQPASAVEKLTDYVIGKKIAPHMIDRLPGEYWQMIADDAGTAFPTTDEIAQIKQNVAAKAVETPPPAAPQAGGVWMEPMPEHIPTHYLEHYTRQGLTVTERDFAKDLRVADYLLSQDPPITPEEFAAKSLEEQNKLIREAPTASGKGKHYAYLENPGPGKGRPAAVGIRHIADTMRWRQAQTPAATEAAAVPAKGIETPAQAEAAFQAEKAKPAPAKRTRRAKPKS